MSTEWYYSSSGQKVGPVSENQIRQLAASGKLAASDLIWRAGQPNWVSAGSVPGLFPGPPPLPTAGHSQPTGSGSNKWVVLGVIAGILLLVFMSLQSMMNSHNRRRQDAIDVHRREAADALRRAEDGLRQLGR
jgi:hypothetical protein